MPLERLDSWKEIAAYLKRDIRSVQRWEKTEGLPVHRHIHGRQRSVYAYRTEIDEWWNNGRSRRPGEPLNLPVQTGPTAGAERPQANRPTASALPVRIINWRIWAAGVTVILLAAGAIAFRYDRRTAPEPPPFSKVFPLTGNPGWEQFPAFSPNGNQVAFSYAPKLDGGSDIYLKLIGAGPALKLTAGSDLNFAPAWSRDGRQIAFLRQAEEGSDILVIPALGGPSRKIGHSAAIGFSWGSMFNPRLSWSPDEKYLAICDKALPSENDAIFLLSVDKGEKRQLTFPNGESTFDGIPAFSPDGGRLAFVRFTGESGGIWVISVDKDGRAMSEPQRVATAAHGPAGLDWTPDGREMLFSHTKIWRVPAGGGQPRPLPNTDFVFHVALSRGVRRLAYTKLSFIAAIWRFNGPNAPARTAAAPVKLIASNGTELGPQYSPDGKRIVFASDRSGSAEIWMSDSEGNSLVQLTTMGGDWLSKGSPRWSPDGKQVAFDAFVNGICQIDALAIESRTVRQITHGPYACSRPSWSRDNQWVYFRSRDQVWKTLADGAGVPTQITRLGGDEPLEDWNAKFVYYYKDDAVWRVPTTGGEETRVVDHAVRGHWALLPSGICLFNRWRKPDPALEFFDFKSRRRRLLAPIPELKGSFEEEALSVSPDGRWVLCVRGDHVESSIQVVENFK